MPSRAKPVHPRLTGDDMLDAGEVADLLRMPLSTVLDFARRGVIPGHKLGRRWIFLRDEIEVSVREAPSQPRVPAHPQPPAVETGVPAQDRPRRYRRALPGGSARLFG
jgi:excisionase family DNA binding protein